MTPDTDQPLLSSNGDAHLSDAALSALVDGELGPAEAAATGHLAGCPACTARRDDLRRVAAAVAAPVRPLDPALADAAIGRALAAAPIAPAHRFVVRGRVLAVAAAVVVLLALAGVGLAHRHADRPHDVAAGATTEHPPHSEPAGGRTPSPAGGATAGPVTSAPAFAPAALPAIDLQPVLARLAAEPHAPDAANAAGGAPAVVFDPRASRASGRYLELGSAVAEVSDPAGVRLVRDAAGRPVALVITLGPTAASRAAASRPRAHPVVATSDGRYLGVVSGRADGGRAVVIDDLSLAGAVRLGLVPR